jgi:hypothetical protein
MPSLRGIAPRAEGTAREHENLCCRLLKDCHPPLTRSLTGAVGRSGDQRAAVVCLFRYDEHFAPVAYLIAY